jgi:signal transduction histidine kinase
MSKQVSNNGASRKMPRELDALASTGAYPVTSEHQTRLKTESARGNTSGTLRPALLFLPTSVVVSWWAFEQGRTWAAVLMVAMSVAIVLWRYGIGLKTRRTMNTQQWLSVERQLLNTNWVSCAIWLVAILSLMPGLAPLPASALVFAMCAGVANAAVHSSGRFAYLLAYSLTLAAGLLIAYSDQIPDYPGAVLLIVLALIAFQIVFSNVTQRVIRTSTQMTRTAIARRLWADRAERRVRAAELRAAEAKSKAAESRSLFVARISHELRTPLQTIISGLEVLQYRSAAVATADPNLGPMIERLGQSAEQVLALSHDLTDFIRWESASHPVQLAPVDVPRLMDDIATNLAERARLRGVRLTVQHKGAPATNVTDASRLRAIVTNLLVNAIKYAPSGPVLLTTRRGEDGALAIEVSDNGPGLPEKVLQVIGTPWVRGDNARVQEEGFGLGLSIVMSLAQDIHASILVESDETGTAFGVILPIETGGNQPQDL